MAPWNGPNDLNLIQMQNNSVTFCKSCVLKNRVRFGTWHFRNIWKNIQVFWNMWKIWKYTKTRNPTKILALVGIHPYLPEPKSGTERILTSLLHCNILRTPMNSMPRGIGSRPIGMNYFRIYIADKLSWDNALPSTLGSCFAIGSLNSSWRSFSCCCCCFFFWNHGSADFNGIFHVSSFLVASLTCHQKIGRVGRVGRGCYEDARNCRTISACPDGLACRWHVRNKSCVSYSWNMDNDTRDILVTSYGDVAHVSGVSARMLWETASVEFRLITRQQFYPDPRSP